MDAIERLLAIEEIKQVKGKYFYAFDHKDWDMWRNEVWAPDGRLDVPEFRPEPFTPFEEVLRYASEAAADQVSVHHGHTPLIEITSETTAKGIWAMEDMLRWPEGSLIGEMHGYGHYHEDYVKVDGSWHIARLKLTRLRRDFA